MVKLMVMVMVMMMTTMMMVSDGNHTSEMFQEIGKIELIIFTIFKCSIMSCVPCMIGLAGMYVDSCQNNVFPMTRSVSDNLQNDLNHRHQKIPKGK